MGANPLTTRESDSDVKYGNIVCIQCSLPKLLWPVVVLQAQRQKRKLEQALKTMRSQKSEIDSLQLQLAQSAQKVRSSVERELRETFQTVKDERSRLCDLVENLECSAKDSAQKLTTVSEELKQQREELHLAYADAKDLKMELKEKNILLCQEADKMSALEQQLDTKSHHCIDLEREINHLKQKVEELIRPKTVAAVTQTLPDFDVVEQDNHIACLEDKLAVTERRMKDALDQLSRTAKERDALRGQLNDMTENSSDMQLKLDKSSSTISNLEFDLKQSADKMSRLERIVSEKEKRNEATEHATNEMKSMVNRLTAENVVLKQQQSDDNRLNSLVSSLEQKNTELTAQVGCLKEELQAKSENDRDVLLQKDEVIARLQLELDGKRQVNQQRHRDEAGLAVRESSKTSKSAKSAVSLDRLKKQHEAELRESENRCSELTSQVDSLKCELRALEVSHQQKVSKLEENIADLASKLSSAERRACRLEQKRTSSIETAECGVQTCEDRLDQSFNISLLTQVPIESSDVVGDVSDFVEQSTSQQQHLIMTFQSRVSELERQLEKANGRKLTDGQDGKLVNIFNLTYHLLLTEVMLLPITAVIS